MLVLAGLPTLFPRLVDARTYAERMFRVVTLSKLSRGRESGSHRETDRGGGVPSETHGQSRSRSSPASRPAIPISSSSYVARSTTSSFASTLMT